MEYCAHWVDYTAAAGADTGSGWFSVSDLRSHKVDPTTTPSTIDAMLRAFDDQLDCAGSCASDADSEAAADMHVDPASDVLLLSDGGSDGCR